MRILIVLLLVLITIPVHVQAQLEEKLKYPVSITDYIEKMEFILIAQEKLRVEHNDMGKKFRDGDITEQEWEDYRVNVFDKRNMLLSNDYRKVKNLMRKSVRYTVDLNDIEKTIDP